MEFIPPLLGAVRRMACAADIAVFPFLNSYHNHVVPVLDRRRWCEDLAASFDEHSAQYDGIFRCRNGSLPRLLTAPNDEGHNRGGRAEVLLHAGSRAVFPFHFRAGGSDAAGG